ncbi:MAG: ABC transporter permease [Marinovum sp.]|nr:ABC transporter permease [Marinovum sp.]
MTRWPRPLRILAALAYGLVLWHVVVWLTDAPRFILPAPLDVAESLWRTRVTLAENLGFTIVNLIIGLTAGVALGLATAVQLVLSPSARVLIRPFLIFAQSVPIFALAPVITLWLGYGAPSKIVMVMLITYFPVTSAFFDGLVSLPSGFADLAQTMRASPWRRLWLLQIPHALPSLGTGLRLAAVYAPFAVVIGEWVGSSKGLGYLMLLANGRGQTSDMFAALAVLACLSVTLFFSIDALANRWSLRGRDMADL